MTVEIEIAARALVAQHLGLAPEVSAPGWRQIMLAGAKRKLSLPRPSEHAAQAVDRDFAGAAPGDPVAATAAELLAALQTSRPRSHPAANLSRHPLPPPRDAMATWARKFFLVATGPASVRLLVAAGYLVPSDVRVIAAAYPAGLDAERGQAVAAGLHLAEVAVTRGHDVELPSWLNGQLYTLMDNRPAVDFYRKLFAATASPARAASGGTPAKSQIAAQARPNPAPDDK